VLILVNHLTRMQPGFFCTAGIDWQTGHHIRPTLPSPQRLENRYLGCHGGLFEMGVLTDLGPVLPRPHPPETEDHQFDPRQAKTQETIKPSLFWKALNRVARCSFKDIFGPGLVRHGPKCLATPPGEGAASLGCLIPHGRPRLHIERRDGKRPRIRLETSDGTYEVDLAVTDIRLFKQDHVTPDEVRIREVDGRLANGTGVILSVGLTRAYSPAPDQVPYHYLQVNNIHLEDKPLWKLA
jgi:hypothetical protein